MRGIIMKAIRKGIFFTPSHHRMDGKFTSSTVASTHLYIKHLYSAAILIEGPSARAWPTYSAFWLIFLKFVKISLIFAYGL